MVATRESCVNLHRAVQVGVQKMCYGILTVDHLLPCKIHREIQRAEFSRNLSSEMLGGAEAGSVCWLGMKSSDKTRWRGWWPCRERVSPATADMPSRKGWGALLWDRMLSLQDGPPGPPSVVPFLHGKHGQRLLAKASSVCTCSKQNESEV